MSNVATKLFREPGEAIAAIKELMAKGYTAEEIVVVASPERGKELGKDIKAISDAAKLADIGVPGETIDYYAYSVPSGGIAVTVKADEARMAQAQEVLRATPICSCEDRICGTSPGFQAAGRMSATNPMDAPMSGDFRRY